jgi:hypothetical protein
MILDGNSKAGEAKVYATAREMELVKRVEEYQALLKASFELIKDYEGFASSVNDRKRFRKLKRQANKLKKEI